MHYGIESQIFYTQTGKSYSEVSSLYVIIFVDITSNSLFLFIRNHRNVIFQI